MSTPTKRDLDAHQPGPAGRKEWTGLAVLALPLLLVSMDVSVLYFAVPFISRDLAPTATQQLWIFDIYGFVLAGLLLTMGSLGDRIGRRKLLLIGAVGFSLASLLAAYSQSAEMLIAARALLGVAGATLMPSTLGLIRNMFHDAKQRSTAIAIWTAVMTSGIAVGPVLSGILLEHFWWGSVFLINIPAMLLLLALGPVLLPEYRRPGSARFDLVSSGLSLATVLPVIYGIKEWAARGFRARLPRLHRGRLGDRGGVRAAAATDRRSDARPVAVRRAAVQRIGRGQHRRDVRTGRERGVPDAVPADGARNDAVLSGALEPGAVRVRGRGRAGRRRAGPAVRPGLRDGRRFRRRRASAFVAAHPGRAGLTPGAAAGRRRRAQLRRRSR